MKTAGAVAVDTANVAVVVLFVVFASESGVAIVAITIYVAGDIGAVSIVVNVADAPAKSVPTLIFAIWDVVPLAASEILAETD